VNCKSGKRDDCQNEDGSEGAVPDWLRSNRPKAVTGVEEFQRETINGGWRDGARLPVVSAPVNEWGA